MKKFLQLTWSLAVFLLVCSEATQPSAKKDIQILASNTSGGWLNVDFIHSGKPLADAKDCVRDRSSAAAVACFAFASREAYAASAPESAGNFKGELCWDARWQRNKQGKQSGGKNSFKSSACP